ncbi:MAG: hypothetical protein ACXW0Q_05790 [Methylovulum sp.]
MEINNWDDFCEYVPENIMGADIEHFLICEYWTLYEAGYLLNDINDEQGYPRRGSPMVKTQKLLEKAAQAGQLGLPVGDGYLPYKIIGYAINKGRRVPDALKSFYEEAMSSEIEVLKSDGNKKNEQQNRVTQKQLLDVKKPDLDNNVDVFFNGYGNWITTIYLIEEPGLHIKIGEQWNESYACGVFVLGHTDTIAFKHTKSLEGIYTLFPCTTHSDRVFPPDVDWSKIQKIGTLGNDLYVDVSFSIDTKKSKPLSIAVPDKPTHAKTAVIDSEQLLAISAGHAILNEAALKFWANADQEEKDTQPKQAEVVKWLKSKGLSDISAQQGAVIIRPEWAAKGRR